MDVRQSEPTASGSRRVDKRRLLAMLAVVIPACTNPTEVVVFHAASLARSFHALEAEFVRAHPGHRLRVEVSGSQTAARKISELNLRADVVAVADELVIDRLLMPAHATWQAHFATNEIVLAHKDHSRYTEEVTTDNWPQVLGRPGVRLGCVNGDLAPIGYRTLWVWQLCDSKQMPGLSRRLRQMCAKEHVMPDEAGLLALLSSRAVDYGFVYRSTAEEHHLKLTAIKPACNLGHQALAADYARASVAVRMATGRGKVTMHGAPVLYGVTIPTNAPHPEAAELFVAFLLGPAGQTSLARSGFSPLVPAPIEGPGPVPPKVLGLGQSGSRRP